MDLSVGSYPSAVPYDVDVLLDRGAPPSLTRGGLPEDALRSMAIRPPSPRARSRLQLQQQRRPQSQYRPQPKSQPTPSSGAPASGGGAGGGGGRGTAFESDSGPAMETASIILEALQIPGLARSAEVLLKAMSHTRSIADGDFRRVMGLVGQDSDSSDVSSDGVEARGGSNRNDAAAAGGGGAAAGALASASEAAAAAAGRKRPRDEAVPSPTDDVVGFNVGLGIGLGVSIGAALGGNADAGSTLRRLSTRLPTGLPTALSSGGEESPRGEEEEAAAAAAVTPAAPEALVQAPPGKRRRGVDEIDGRGDTSGKNGGSPQAPSPSAGPSLPDAAMEAPESSRTPDDGGDNGSGSGLGEDAGEEPPAEEAEGGGGGEESRSPDEETPGKESDGEEKKSGGDDGKKKGGEETTDEEEEEEEMTETGEGAPPPLVAKVEVSASLIGEEGGGDREAGSPVKEEQACSPSANGSHDEEAAASGGDAEKEGNAKGADAGDGDGTYCVRVPTRRGSGESTFCQRMPPGSRHSLISGRESHTSNMKNFDKLIEDVKLSRRPPEEKDGDRKNGGDESDNDDVKETPFHALFWSYVRSVLERAIPVGFEELTDPEGVQPKGPADSAAFLAKFVETSVLNPIHPVVIADSSGVSADAVMTELFYAAKTDMMDMKWGPLCERCGSTACASRRLEDLPRKVFCDGCKYENDVDCLDKIKVIFNLNRDVFYTPMESFACTPSQSSMAANVIFAVVPATSTGSGFRYSAGCGEAHGDVCPALPPGRYRMHCPVAKTDNFLFVRREVTDGDRPIRLKLRVSDLVCRPGDRRKTYILPHGRIHFDVYTDTRSFYVLWVQQDLDDGTLLYLPQQERPPFTSAKEVLQHPAFQRLFQEQVEGMVMAAVKMMRPARAETAGRATAGGRKKNGGKRQRRKSPSNGKRT